MLKLKTIMGLGMLGVLGTILLALAACGGDDKGGEDQYTFRYANISGMHHTQSWRDTVAPWASAVEAATAGRVKTEAFHGGSLCNTAEMVDCLSNGLADGGMTLKAFFPDRFPLHQFSGVTDPEIGPRLTGEQEAKVGRILYDEIEELRNDLEGQNIMNLFNIASFGLHFNTTVPIATLEDLEGLRIRTFGAYMPKAIEAAGGVATSLPAVEVFDALSRGLVDGALTNPLTFRDQGFYEAGATHVSLLGDLEHGISLPMSAGIALDVNLDWWKSLDNQAQCAVLHASKVQEFKFAEFTAGDNAQAIQVGVDKHGVKVINLPDAELKKWAAKVPDLFGIAAEAMNAHGPGTKIVNRYLELTQASDSEINQLWETAWDNRFTRWSC
jgi:TRAP-type C4-dicarboxylate transport system substrate-binding protein